MNETTAESDDRRSSVIRWILLTGNRLAVSVVALLGIGALFVVAGVSGLATVTTPTRVMWYLNGTVNGLLTLVPIAVGVNQIILSHEFGSIRDLHQRRRDITEFREQVGQEVGVTLSSPDASAFFGALFASISDIASELRRGSGRVQDDGAAELGSVARSVADQAERTGSKLDAGDPGMLETLIVMLDYDDSRHFDQVRRLKEDSSDDIGTTELLRQLEERFVEIDAARQYLKTVVVERQLARLSRLLVYTGIPAVALAALGIFAYRDIAGLELSHPLLVVAAATLLAGTLVPLAILGAYILRVATIARRTAAFGPFVPESDR